MSKRLGQLNLALIVLVGGLCLFQWHREHEADTQIIELRRVAHEQERTIAGQADSLKGANEDISSFKTDVEGLKRKSDQSDVEIRLQKARIFSLEREKEHHEAEARVWKRTLEAYEKAVGDRDSDIKALFSQRDQLIGANKGTVKKANDAVEAYNQLVSKYEDVVAKYNDLATRYKAEHAAPAAPPAGHSS
jgi:septal ring factor EnvC (AmiA/AmiB activator)